jgi:heme o synthase
MELHTLPKAPTPWAVPTRKGSSHSSGSNAPAVADAEPHAPSIPSLRDLIALTKPRITALVLLTGAAGIRLAPGAPASSSKLWLSLIGMGLIVASANALNMWWERDVDGHMARTRARPLPAGRMSPDAALAFGIALGAVGVPLLFLVNFITGMLGVVSLVLYVAVYTPLKKRTFAALLVGAVPGAIPPLMGWTAVTGRVDLGGVLLFAFLFLWQVPHFAAISIFRSDDYSRAGLQVISVQHGERAAIALVAASSALLVVSSLLLGFFGVAGRPYELFATLLGALVFALALRGIARGPKFDVRRWAKRVFALSIPYLAILLILLVSGF